MHSTIGKYPCQANSLSFGQNEAGPDGLAGPRRALFDKAGPASVLCSEVSFCRAPGCRKLVSGPKSYCSDCEYVLRRC